MQPQAGTPGAQIGGEHAIGLALLGQHFTLFKHHMVLHLYEGNALGLQGLPHRRIALLGLGLVVPCGKHGIDLQGLGQGRHSLSGAAVQHDQAGLRLAAGRTQRRIHLHQGGAYEFHAPVAPGQGVQNVGIEHKSAQHALALVQCGGQSQVVLHAQIAPQPHQSSGKKGLHGYR